MEEDPMDDINKEVYTYEAPWPIYALSWSANSHPKYRHRLALGSFIEDYSNKVQIVQLNPKSGAFEQRGEFSHPYPATKLMWNPDRSENASDLLATSGDYLRLWDVGEDGEVRPKIRLNNNKTSEFCAPLTSFDWNETDSSILGTSSIDTTCTIWDVQAEAKATQLIAHDKEVFDIAFARGTHLFASVGNDGSVRMFDRRNLEHSTIMYESPDLTPLLRLAWNRQDDYYLATFGLNSNKVTVLDIRVPSVPAAELVGHTACVNALSWAPHSSCHLSSVGDDSMTLIWDLSSLPKPVEDPVLAYQAEGEVNSLQWSVAHIDWIAIAFADKMRILRV